MDIDRSIRQSEYPNADTIAHRYGISKRQASKDCEFLINQLDAPLAHHPERNGWYYAESMRND